MSTTVLFEENYIFRNNKSITSNNDVALTEFIANSWDAGAHNVEIIIPDCEGELISVEDDGVGMSDEEFRSRWMTLNYDRIKRQGKDVTFPDDAEKSKRVAYGRNGIGRHGMLCFSNSYTVETWKDGKCNKYDIAISKGDAPFEIVRHTASDKAGHGTKISAFVNRHLPDAETMTDVLSARFMYDPNFIVKINGRCVDLSQHKGVVFSEDIKTSTGKDLLLIVIDSEKTAAKSQQHGIAFWISGRLVGQPSWTHGKVTFLDGRFKAAKRYTIIVKTDDLIDDVLPDWSGFNNSPIMEEVYQEIKVKVDKFIKTEMRDRLAEIRLDVIREARDDLETLNISGLRNVSAFIEKVTDDNPVISQDYLHSAVEAMIMKPDQILIVEVKRGGFEITDQEVNQVEYYVRQIRKSAVLHSSATIDAFVVGAKLGDIDPEKKTTSGSIHAVTYGQLVDTASGRLFRLRDKLKEHYSSLGDECIVEQALKEPKQLKMDFQN